jgi:hypothetical protein
MNARAAPDDPWSRAMRGGDFAAAWRHCDQVLAWRVARGERCDRMPRHQQFIWRGQPLAGRRVLVRCYHGLGDTLQFARFARPLRERAREVTFWVQPPLLRLIADVAGVDRALPLHDGTPDIDHDADIEVMELAHALRIEAASLAIHVPYVKPRAVAAHDRRTTRPRVGIAWAAGDWNPARSLPAPLVRDLLSQPGIDWYSLQFGEPLPDALGCEDLACQDIAEFAQRVATLDLVITVDSMVAHLAGAMGMPVWTLLPTPCDWRWMAGGTDTPWYPTMRLYRQEREGEWQPALSRVYADLGQLADGG